MVLTYKFHSANLNQVRNTGLYLRMHLQGNIEGSTMDQLKSEEDQI